MQARRSDLNSSSPLEIWPCQPGLLRAGQQRRTGGARGNAGAVQGGFRIVDGAHQRGDDPAMLMGKRHALGQPLQQRRGRIGGEQKRLSPGGWRRKAAAEQGFQQAVAVGKVAVEGPIPTPARRAISRSEASTPAPQRRPGPPRSTGHNFFLASALMAFLDNRSTAPYIRAVLR